MRRINIKQLKNGLSYYINSLQDGEILEVKSRTETVGFFMRAYGNLSPEMKFKRLKKLKALL